MTPLTWLDIGAPSAPTLLLVIKATMILVATVILAGALHKAAAGVRHLIWLVAIGAILLLPALSQWTPISVRVLPATTLGAPDATLENNAIPLPPVLTARTTDAATTEPPSTPLPSLRVVVIGIWATVTALLLARLLLGTLAVRRIVQAATPLGDADWNDRLYDVADRLGIANAPRVVMSNAIHVPFATGLLHATIVLPAECMQWTPGQRDAVLIHELGHVRRRDLLGHTLGRLACAFYWFHPLVWTAARRLRDASERACDDLALRLGSRPSEYAEHLLQIVTAAGRPAVPSVALAMAQRKEFEGRMLAILDPALKRESLPRWQMVSLTGGLVAMSLLVAAAAPAPVVPPAQATALVSGGNDTTSLADAPQQGASIRPPERSAAPEPPESPDPRMPIADVNVNLNSSPRVTVREPGAAPDALGDANPEVLAKLLRSDPSGEVRRIAAWALHDHASLQVARAALAEAAESDADARVRTMAVWSLESLRDTRVTTVLGHVLTRDSDAEAREMAAWALGQFADPAAAGPLATQLAKESSDKVLATIAWAIGNVPMERAPAGLTALLTSSSPRTRLTAAWALSNIADKATLPAVHAALRQPQESNTARALVRAAIATDISTEALSELLSSRDSTVRATAVRAMGGKLNAGNWPWPWPWPRPIPSL
jgi:beta-lactamase regulating signal transducer with metallopeptidase domain/HEAT repeat protein